MNNALPTPEWGEVRDYETEYQPQTVPVSIKGTSIVDVRPAKHSNMRAHHVPFMNDVNNSQPIEIVPADPRIKWVTLKAYGSNPGNIYLGTLEQVVLARTGHSDAFYYDGSTVLGPWSGFDQPLYAFADVTGTNIISVRIEYWAD